MARALSGPRTHVVKSSADGPRYDLGGILGQPSALIGRALYTEKAERARASAPALKLSNARYHPPRRDVSTARFSMRAALFVVRCTAFQASTESKIHHRSRLPNTEPMRPDRKVHLGQHLLERDVALHQNYFRLWRSEVVREGSPGRVFISRHSLEPDARISRARRAMIINRVARMNAALLALRLNELLGGVVRVTRHLYAKTKCAAPETSRATPSGVLSLRPQGAFFSIPITTARIIIHMRLPTPTTNMRSMSAQQQPTQKTPWSTPSRKACQRSCRPCQCPMTKLKGERHLSRQRYLRDVN